MSFSWRHHPRTPVALATERALSTDARRLGRLLRDPSLWPPRWSESAFGAEVERCRRHVADMTTQAALAAAYEYDILGLRRDDIDRAEDSPIRVAYALRWLELQEGSTGPSWPAMVAVT